MTNYKLTIEYLGTAFVGMQRQGNGLGVQEVIEDAILKFSGEKATISMAGRTDSGVHALNQVISFKLQKDSSPEEIIGAINYYAKPHPLVVIKAEIVDEEFNARFSATSRSYIYKILNREAPSAIMSDRAWHVEANLNVDAMNAAAQILVGQHDFTSFRTAACQAKSAIKTITAINVSKKPDDIIEIYVKAPSFLHNQVRIIVGSLKFVGEGKWDAAKFEAVLHAKDRRLAAVTAPAYGLYFIDVSYPNTKLLPK